MADDKAKIDWKMLETAAAEPAAVGPVMVEPFSVEPAPVEPVPVEPATVEPAVVEPASAPAEAAPAAPAEKIVFRCENGHRIVVSATLAGQRGKCSKCGVAVRIPTKSKSAAVAPRVAETQSGGTGAEGAAEPPAVAAIPSATAADERFGGGSSQQADHEDPQAVGQSEPREDMFSGLVAASDSQVSATEFVEFSQQSLQADASRLEPPLPGSEGPVNPTAALVARLFQEMEHGGIVEVHITGGSVILPEFYEQRWSGGSHGLFASRAADGTVTLTAVAWDSIQKIIVRQVEGLPDGMFE
jgi:hypothetical protein